MKSIDKKMDSVIKLLALVAVQGKEDSSQIKMLASLGFTSEEIGLALGKSAGTVRWHMHSMKKKSKTKKGDNHDG